MRTTWRENRSGLQAAVKLVKRIIEDHLGTNVDPSPSESSTPTSKDREH
jgi:hypothetical protein